MLCSLFLVELKSKYLEKCYIICFFLYFVRAYISEFNVFIGCTFLTYVMSSEGVIVHVINMKN